MSYSGSNFTRLSLSIAAASLATMSHGAGLDLSGQDIKGFFNEGTYAEIDYVYVNTDISGYDNAGLTPDGKSVGITEEAKYVKGNPIDNITGDAKTFMRYGVKTDINDNLSVGVFYDEPWGANVRVMGDNNFVSKEKQVTAVVTQENAGRITTTTANSEELNANIKLPDYDKQTNVKVDARTLTGLVGVKSNGFQIYGGPVMQEASAEVHLRGRAYGPSSGYDAVASKDTAYGWTAGISYSIPEIALNAALTYRSEIEHSTVMEEIIPIFGPTTSTAHRIIKNQIAKGYGYEDFDSSGIQARAVTQAIVKTPESVNLNFQTGVNPTTLLMVNARWVPWSDFKIVPPFYSAFSKAADPNGLALLDYDKDGWQVDVGIGKRLADNLAVSGVIGWDSGAGNPVSSLGPVDGNYSVGFGAKYNITDEWAISGGGKYIKFGDAKAKLPTGAIVGDFQDNDGYVLGVKLSYQSL